MGFLSKNNKYRDAILKSTTRVEHPINTVKSEANIDKVYGKACKQAFIEKVPILSLSGKNIQGAVFWCTKENRPIGSNAEGQCFCERCGCAMDIAANEAMEKIVAALKRRDNENIN